MFQFKQKSQDFIVEERLPFALKGQGDAFFVYFEKQGLTTMDIINHLCRTLKISRKTLGVGGLKDKTAITRQWISIYKSALKRIGGKEIFLDALATKAKILNTNRHSKPIGMTSGVMNAFYIRLRGPKTINQETKTMIKKSIEQLFQK